MKRLCKILLLSIIFCSVFSSCTIQKRQHLPGFHVEWHGSKCQSDKNNQGEATSITQKSPPIPNSELSFMDHTQDSLAQSEKTQVHASDPTTVNKASRRNHEPRFKSGSSPFGYRNHASLHPYYNAVPPHQENAPSEPTAMISLFLAIAGWVASFAANVVAIPLLGVLSFFMLLIAFILSIIAIKRIKAQETSGMGAAVAALVISGLYFLIILLAIILIIAIFGGY
jgi:hypothetical protein